VATVERSIEIDAPVEEVFRYMDHPPHQAEITPSMTEVKNVERLPNGGSRADWTYQIAGVPFRGTVEATEYVPNEKLAFSMTGSLEGTITWTFEPRNGGTRFTYSADYKIPVPALGESLAKLAAGYNEREVESILQNLKELMESREAES
jgi:uncharacterized protein YndB with AHSA1/START domain